MSESAGPADATDGTVPFVDLTPGTGAEPPAAAETHLSVLFFAGHRAYKLLKPVDYHFIRLARLDDRQTALDQELAINRRFAPDVYLGVMDLVDGEGVVHDRALVMRRLPTARRLSALLGRPEGPEQVRRVAKQVAAIHGGAPRPPAAAEAASWDTVAANWSDNFETMEPFAGSIFDPDEFETVRDLTDRYLQGRRPLFERRIEDGHAVDGHGDLLAEDIFCLEDGPRILDCLAFDERLRCGDVLADVAFLAMDVERLGQPDLALAFVSWYREFANEHHPASLAHFYIGYRAHVRAKINALRAAQGDERAAAAAAGLHDQCLRHLRRAQPRIVLLGGGPGTGKTTLAEAIAGRLGWSVVGSDELRKDLASRAHGEHGGEGLYEGIYGPEQTERVYRELVRRAGLLAALGESVIIDASWADAGHRETAREEARQRSTAVVELRCVVDLHEAATRVRRRLRAGGDASDATPEVVAQLSARMAPWPEAITVDTGGPIDVTVSEAVAHLGGGS